MFILILTLAILAGLSVAYYYVGFAFGRDEDRHTVDARWIKYPRAWKIVRW